MKRELCVDGGIGRPKVRNMGPFFVLLHQISKSLCKFDFGLFQPISGLEMNPVKIWIIVGCCWVPQIRAKPEKKI